MTDHVMPAETVCAVLAALEEYGVDACVGGGWGVDALLRRQTREHGDLDLWVAAAETEGLLAGLARNGIDHTHPWPGDRPWNFVLHDGRSLRVDLHFYEVLEDGRLHYGSVAAPFRFGAQDLAGRGEIAGTTVRCERAEFSLRNHTGYPPRDSDRHDVAVLCRELGLEPPEGYLEGPDGT